MFETLSRREFIKLLSLLPAVRLVPPALAQTNSQQKNVLILVFDAWSAYNLHFSGYRRQTTPHLGRLLDHAIVYHNHISAANFTTPGTSSLLTGTYSWTHRAFNHDVPANHLIKNNIFNAFGDSYYRLGYSHNPLAAHIIHKFLDDLESYIPTQDLFLTNTWIDQLFPNDYDISTLSNFVVFEQEDNWNSLFLRKLYQAAVYKERNAKAKEYQHLFPTGLPYIAENNYYILEDGIDWLANNLATLPQPYMGYFHFLPPHQPYKTRAEFLGHFAEDEMTFPEKPNHPLASGAGEEKIFNRRTEYDEYILYVDAEIGRLFEHLKASGQMENTWIVITSDHGEMFERGEIGHTTKLLSNPVIRIPLVLFEPGRKDRQDIYTATSSLDVLPTVTHLAGLPIPDWCEGEILPPYHQDNTSRSIFSIQAKQTPKYGPISEGSISLFKGPYKLTHYFGYKELGGEELTELFDIDTDKEELNDLSEQNPAVAKVLLDELKTKLAEVNQPYLK